MSAIAGIFSRSGKPIDRELLKGLSGAFQERGPDGESFVWGEKNVEFLRKRFALGTS